MLQCGSYAQSNDLKKQQMNTTRNELAIRLKDYIQKEISQRKIVGLSVALIL